MSWSLEEKARMFDQISEHYYRQNFGSFTKADMELLMFHFYLENEINTTRLPDGMIDYNKCSDYSIGKRLGITQQRVKSLKIKKQLIYPLVFDWKKALAALMKNARYEPEQNKITLSIPDPNLLIEIQNYVEENGGYFATQLNSKLLSLRVEYFFELAYLVEDGKNQKTIEKALVKELKKHTKNEPSLEVKSVGKSLMEFGANSTTILANLLTLFNPTNVIASALIGII